MTRYVSEWLLDAALTAGSVAVAVVLTRVLVGGGVLAERRGR